ncbi:MAG: redoxin domain-containing protein [Chitinophagaceae bacterium]|nr:MAG: redoxin domain-containing protein [Chitinophagaceae bacterium]
MKFKTLVFLFLICIAVQAKSQQTTSLNKRIQAMSKEEDPQKNVSAMATIIKEFKLDSGKNMEEIDLLIGNVALSFLKAQNYTPFEAYIAKIKNRFNQTSFLNMAVYHLVKIKDYKYAQTIAKKTVDLYDSYKENPLARPEYFSVDDWNRFMQMAAYPYYETYAEVLHLNGENKKALFYEEKAFQGQQGMMPSSSELYCTLLIADGQTDKAYPLLLKAVSIGKATLKMTDMFKNLALQKLGSEAKVSLFLDSIHQAITTRYRTEIAKSMFVNTAAPPFNLLDLNGKTVSLASLKGKIVVLDFWATWCAPCIAAMPAMKEMERRHKDVVFLFIATQETGKQPTKNVKTYVAATKFPLNVLIDERVTADSQIFKVASAYNVKSIPTKVVIDKDGKLRFITTGYQSDHELINELEAMISIVTQY